MPLPITAWAGHCIGMGTWHKAPNQCTLSETLLVASRGLIPRRVALEALLQIACHYFPVSYNGFAVSEAFCVLYAHYVVTLALPSQSESIYVPVCLPDI